MPGNDRFIIMKTVGRNKSTKISGKMSDEKIISLIKQNLPRLLRKDPSLKESLIVLFKPVFVEKKELAQVLEELRLQRLESNKRFEAIDRRFEAMDRRFEQMREDMNRQFKEMREDFREAIEKTAKALSSRMDALGSRWGLMAEEALRSGIDEVASRLGFSVGKWRKRDEKGEFFLQPRDVEIDILVKNSKIFALELKSSLTVGEVECFERAVRFYEKTEGRQVDERVIVCIYPMSGSREYAGILGIKILPEIEEIKNII